MKKPRDKHVWKPNLDIQTENIRKSSLILSLELLILLYLPSSPGFVAHVPLPLLQLHCLQLLASDRLQGRLSFRQQNSCSLGVATQISKSPKTSKKAELSHAQWWRAIICKQQKSVFNWKYVQLWTKCWFDLLLVRFYLLEYKPTTGCQTMKRVCLGTLSGCLLECRTCELSTEQLPDLGYKCASIYSRQVFASTTHVLLKSFVCTKCTF